jgi:hypothetical protein
MGEFPRIPILLPLLVSAIVFLLTIFIHSLPSLATVEFIRQEKRRGLAGRGFWSDIGIVALVIFWYLVAHLIEMGVWAGLFVLCGEFREFGVAYYHSAVNFTTLGYGDILLSPSWRLLGPLEAANGVVLFGVSTAGIFAVIERLVQTRYVDLRE